MTNDLVIDAFERVKQIVYNTVEELSVDDLVFRPGKAGNSIAWLVWHLTRVQDYQIAALAITNQVWDQGWYERFKLPFSKDATGYGQTSEEVASVKAEATLLLDYYDTVHFKTIEYVRKLKESDYAKIVDKSWNPPVTLSARLVSTISDDLQHAGQAAYIKGLLT
jgi:uncharacterized damage-inducible protein DinB